MVPTRQTMSSGPLHDGVLGYIEEGGLVASMFEHFCTRNLCVENWDFIVAACKYEVRREEMHGPGVRGLSYHGTFHDNRKTRSGNRGG